MNWTPSSSGSSGETSEPPLSGLASRELPGKWGEHWRIGPEDQPQPARRCRCLRPAELEDEDGAVRCTKCGREASIRLGPAVSAAEQSRGRRALSRRPSV
jgi:hypothetical protein